MYLYRPYHNYIVRLMADTYDDYVINALMGFNMWVGALLSVIFPLVVGLMLASLFFILAKSVVARLT